jgi:DNA-binding CsgD family transcriptional regulator
VLDAENDSARLFSGFGLGAEAEAVYLALATRTAGQATALAEQTGRSAAQVHAALAALAAAGLVQSVDDGAFRARAPEYAFRELLDRRQRELDDDRANVERLGEVFRRSATVQDLSQVLQIVTGRTAVAAAACDLQESAQYEVRSLVKPPVIGQPARQNGPVQNARMAKGVCYRTVYESSMLAEEGELRMMEESMRWGEATRTVARVPVKMMIADTHQALIPLERDSRRPTAALVRHRGLITILEELFERVWETATPVPTWQHAPIGPAPDGDSDGQAGSTVPADDLRLLSLLVAGLTDQALAVHLGVSKRTVERRIRRLMDKAGATTRIQLALYAARHHWI